MGPMQAALWLGATVAPGEDNFDPSTVSPGLGGFLVTFALALAVVVLARSMAHHLRKVRYSEPPQDPQDPREPRERPREQDRDDAGDGSSRA